jgi:hypothetical protein
MTTFEIGDRVVCIDAQNSCQELEKGKTYNVTQRDKSYIRINNLSFWWRKSRFEKESMTTQLNKKAKPSAKQKAEAYYVRHKPSGHGVSLAASQSSSVQVPATMIATYDDAVNEANRLAELHAGSEFVILGVVYRVKKVPVYTTEATEYSV